MLKSHFAWPGSQTNCLFHLIGVILNRDTGYHTALPMALTTDGQHNCRASAPKRAYSLLLRQHPGYQVLHKEILLEQVTCEEPCSLMSFHLPSSTLDANIRPWV